MARNGWVYDWDDPSNMVNLFETGNGNNDGKYSSKEFDAAVDNARKATDWLPFFVAGKGLEPLTFGL